MAEVSSGVAVAVTRVAAKVVRSMVAEERVARSFARVLAGNGRGGVVCECFTSPVWASNPGRRLLCKGVVVGIVGMVGMVSDLLKKGKKVIFLTFFGAAADFILAS
jgi:hypothetical protein